MECIKIERYEEQTEEKKKLFIANNIQEATISIDFPCQILSNHMLQ